MATVYRNLQEQVYENAKDIEELNNRITGINHIRTDSSEVFAANDINNNGTVKFMTSNNFNDDKVPKIRYLMYLGEYFKYVYGDNSETDPVYRLKLPTKSGTLALVEDIPVNTGYIKAHTIENDADKNYKTIINLGSGNSGSTLHLEAPGDNGIGSIDIANEYNQGSTSIKFTADKLVFGNTEITEAQLQQLIQLIQNQ